MTEIWGIPPKWDPKTTFFDDFAT